MTFWGPFRVPESEYTSYERRKYDISLVRLCPSLKAARGNRRHSPGGGRRGFTAVCKTFQWRRRPLEDSYLYCFISIMVLLSTSISWIGQPYSIPPLPFGIWSCPISRGNYEGLDLLPYSCRLELPQLKTQIARVSCVGQSTSTPSLTIYGSRLTVCCSSLAMCGPNLAKCNPSLAILDPTLGMAISHMCGPKLVCPFSQRGLGGCGWSGRPNVRRFYFLRNRTRAHQVTGLSQDTLSKPVLSSPEESWAVFFAR